MFGFRSGKFICSFAHNAFANNVENSMLIGRALSAARCQSSAALEFLLLLIFFSAIFIAWIIMEIQTHNRMRKANFVENKEGFVTGSGN